MTRRTQRRNGRNHNPEPHRPGLLDTNLRHRSPKHHIQHSNTATLHLQHHPLRLLSSSNTPKTSHGTTSPRPLQPTDRLLPAQSATHQPSQNHDIAPDGLSQQQQPVSAPNTHPCQQVVSPVDGCSAYLGPSLRHVAARIRFSHMLAQSLSPLSGRRSLCLRLREGAWKGLLWRLSRRRRVLLVETGGLGLRGLERGGCACARLGLSLFFLFSSILFSSLVDIPGHTSYKASKSTSSAIRGEAVVDAWAD